jgi:hypothetical protein
MKRVLLTAALAVAAPAAALADAALEVVVRDQATGAPVAGTTVRLTNEATGFVAEKATDSAGKALFGALATNGAYVAEVSGAAAQPVELRSNYTPTVTLLLARKAGLEEVLVQGTRSVSGLNLTSAEVSSGFTAQELAALPVEARDLSTVLFRLPNVTQATGFFPEAPAVSINGANSLFTQYLIDGLDNNENFLGGQKFATPIGIVRDVTVLANSYSTEFGRTANGVVNVTTKGGGNDAHGEAFFLWRPGAAVDAKAKSPLRDLSGNAVLDGFKRFQGGAALSGPLVRDRTFFFVDAEITRDTKDNRLTVPKLRVDETIRGHNSFDYYTLRLDQVFSDSWSATLRAHRGDVAIERQGGGLEGGTTFPSAGDTQTRLSHIVALETRYSGSRLSYEGDLQFSAFDWNYGKTKPGPQVVLQDASAQTIGTIGSNGFYFDDTERTWETRHKVAFDLDGGPFGRQRVKAGIDILRADFSLRGGGNPAGNYTVQLTGAQLDQIERLNRGAALGVNDIPADARVTAFSTELRPSTFGRPQTLYAGWVESEFDVTRALTARFGLRYDYDSLTKYGSGKGDTDNLSPRGSFTYRLDEDRAIRGGAGLFYEKIPYTVISDALQRNSDTTGFRNQLQALIDQGRLPANTNLNRILFNGNTSYNTNTPNFAYLQGPSGASLAATRETLGSSERQILNPFGYKNPSSIQASLGYQQRVGGSWLVEGDLLYSRGRNLIRLVDVNSPTPYKVDPANPQVRSVADANASRPTNADNYAGGANSILISDTGGKSRYEALNVAVTKEQQPDDIYALRLSYTLSRLKNDTDDINFRAQDANNFADEWAVSLNDRTHALSAMLLLYPVDGLTLSVTGLFQSGQAINYGPDATRFGGTTDLNGDGRSFANQYTGNPDRAPGVRRNSGRLPWSKTVDLGIRYALPLGPGEVEVSADVFNVFNSTNLSGYVVNATASNQFQIAGQPFIQRSAGPPRTFQFGLRYAF